MSIVNKSYEEQLERVKKSLELSDLSEKLSDRVFQVHERSSSLTCFVLWSREGCHYASRLFTVWEDYFCTTLALNPEKKAVMQSRDFI